MGKGAASLGDGVEAEVVGTMQFALPATYKFHKQRSVDVEVRTRLYICVCMAAGACCVGGFVVCCALCAHRVT